MSPFSLSLVKFDIVITHSMFFKSTFVCKIEEISPNNSFRIFYRIVFRNFAKFNSVGEYLLRSSLFMPMSTYTHKFTYFTLNISAYAETNYLDEADLTRG